MKSEKVSMRDAFSLLTFDADVDAGDVRPPGRSDMSAYGVPPQRRAIKWGLGVHFAI